MPALQAKTNPVRWDNKQNTSNRQEIFQVSQMLETNENTMSLNEPQRSGPNPEWGHCIVFLGKTLTTTLTDPLSTQVHK